MDHKDRSGMPDGVGDLFDDAIHFFNTWQWEMVGPRLEPSPRQGSMESPYERHSPIKFASLRYITNDSSGSGYRAIKGLFIVGLGGVKGVGTREK